jgi:hypothetical protein
MDPYMLLIQELEDEIRVHAAVIKSSVKTPHGKVSYRKESCRRSWNTDALLGYASAGHEELLQFYKESVTKASVTITIIEDDD